MFDQKELARLLDALPTAAYVCDAEGLITHFNRAAADIWGREPKLNDPGHRFCGSFKLYALDGSPIAPERSWIALALKKLPYRSHEVVVERPNGSRATVLAHTNPLTDERGKVIGAVNILIDITRRKIVEEALFEALRSRGIALPSAV